MIVESAGMIIKRIYRSLMGHRIEKNLFCLTVVAALLIGGRIFRGIGSGRGLRGEAGGI